MPRAVCRQITAKAIQDNISYRFIEHIAKAYRTRKRKHQGAIQEKGKLNPPGQIKRAQATNQKEQEKRQEACAQIAHFVCNNRPLNRRRKSEEQVAKVGKDNREEERRKIGIQRPAIKIRKQAGVDPRKDAHGNQVIDDKHTTLSNKFNQ
jgi:hypothetical protein